MNRRKHISPMTGRSGLVKNSFPRVASGTAGSLLLAAVGVKPESAQKPFGKRFSRADLNVLVSLLKPALTDETLSSKVSRDLLRAVLLGKDLSTNPPNAG